MFNIRKVFLISLSTIFIYLIVAFGLVYLSEPTFEKPLEMSPEEFRLTGLNFDQNYSYTPAKFETRDGIKLNANRFEGNSNTTILFVHGILANSFQFNTTAGLLNETTNSDILMLDLRGHGQSEGRPGDLVYLDQYVDDLSDVIGALRKEQPGKRIILAGHSMGGGIAMRYALRKNVVAVDGYMLFAPALGWEAPTTRQESASDDEPFAKLHLARFIGLSLLNSVNITQFNNKNVLYFNLPEGSPLTAYTYTSLSSMSPEVATKAFQAIDKPLLLIVGENDEMFYADRYEPLVRTNSEGMVYVVKEANHNSVHYNAKALVMVKNWLLEKYTN